MGEVEHHGVRRVAVEHTQRSEPVADLLHIKASEREPRAEHLSQVRIVLNEEDALSARHLPDHTGPKRVSHVSARTCNPKSARFDA